VAYWWRIGGVLVTKDFTKTGIRSEKKEPKISIIWSRNISESDKWKL